MVAAHHVPTGRPNLARTLKHRLEAHQPVPLRPNVGVEFQDGARLDTVIVPLRYRGHWFRLQQTGEGLRSLRVVPVKPVALTPERWQPARPHVTATTRAAVIRVSSLTQEPDAVIRFSNGGQELVAVGQASANGRPQ